MYIEYGSRTQAPLAGSCGDLAHHLPARVFSRNLLAGICHLSYTHAHTHHAATTTTVVVVPSSHVVSRYQNRR